MFRARASGSPDLEVGSKSPLSARQAFRQTMLTEVLNPKTALFYVALLSRFSDPAVAFSTWAQRLVLGTIVNLKFFSADAVCLVLADGIARLFNGSGGAQIIANMVPETVLAAFGAGLARDRG